MRNAFLFVLFLFAAAGMSAQTVDEIVAKHREAMGGDNWARVKSMKMEAKVNAQSAPGMEIPLSLLIVRDNAARIEVSVMGMTQITVVHGESGWTINPFTGQNTATPLAANEVRGMKEMTDLDGTLVGYADKGYKVELIGSEEVEGAGAYKFKIDKGEGRLEYNFIDKESFLSIKSIEVTTVDGQEFSSTSLMSDFKSIDGIVYPGRIEQDNPMMGSSVTMVTNYVINPEVDEAQFAMPEDK